MILTGLMSSRIKDKGYQVVRFIVPVQPLRYQHCTIYDRFYVLHFNKNKALVDSEHAKMLIEKLSTRK